MNPSDSPNPQTPQRNAGDAPLKAPINRTNEPHAGDHLSQYGMRSKRAVDGTAPAENAPEEIDGLQAFDDEYTTREARDQRPRSIPTGVKDPTGTAGHQHPTPRE